MANPVVSGTSWPMPEDGNIDLGSSSDIGELVSFCRVAATAIGTSGETTAQGDSTIAGKLTITDTDASTIAAGPAGATNPTLQVDASTSSAATGVKIKSAAAASGVAISAISSGTNETLYVDAKGTGNIELAATSTGDVNVGGTNPAFTVDHNASSAATGVKVTAAAAAGGVAVAAISSGTNESLTIDAKGTGTITLNGTATGNVISSRNVQLPAAICTSNVGAVNTGVTAVEYGDGYNHTTVLTVSQVDALTVADNAALADGYLLYTLPAGACVINSAYMTMAVTLAEDTTATADVGLGTTVGSGANATLNAVGAAAENILTGQTSADCNGTATVKTVADQVLVIESGGDHTVYFNVADTWADTAGVDLTGDIAGTVVLNWSFMA